MKIVKPKVNIYADGACSGNPGPGGWASYIQWIVPGEGIKDKTITGHQGSTTNNRMELVAIGRALRELEEPSDVVVYTDSQLAIGWLQRQYKRRDPKIVGICSLIDRIILEGEHRVVFRWVRGHEDTHLNVHVDALAKQALEEGRKKRGEG